MLFTVQEWDSFANLASDWEYLCRFDRSQRLGDPGIDDFPASFSRDRVFNDAGSNLSNNTHEQHLAELKPLFAAVNVLESESPTNLSQEQESAGLEQDDYPKHMMRFLLDSFFILHPFKNPLSLIDPRRINVETSREKSVKIVATKLHELRRFFEQINQKSKLLSWLNEFISAPVARRLYAEPGVSFKIDHDTVGDCDLPRVIKDDIESRTVLAEQVLDCDPRDIIPSNYSLPSEESLSPSRGEY